MSERETRDRNMGGERGLWAAVLNVAIEDAKGNIRGLSGSAAEAESWRARLWLTKPNKGFDDVCHLAGLDPIAVRERCRRMFKEERSEPVKVKGCAPRAPNTTAEPRTLTYAAQTHLIAHWAMLTGITPQTIASRLRYGWTVERTLTTPVRGRPVTGVVQNFPPSKGTGGGSVAQEIS